MRLRKHPATPFTPHLGSAVHRVRLAIEHRAADNVLAVLAGGEPPDRINQPRCHDPRPLFPADRPAARG